MITVDETCSILNGLIQISELMTAIQISELMAPFKSSLDICGMETGSLKFVAIGDGSVGKTCLLLVYQKRTFPQEYVPTVFENSRCRITFKKTEYRVELWDTAGQEELVNVRQLSYPNTDVFLMCFSVANRDSFMNIKTMWTDEVREFMGSSRVLLVGCKVDLRENVDDPVTTIEGRQMAKEIGALDYLECAAVTKQGIDEVFERAVACAVMRECRGCCCSVE